MSLNKKSSIDTSNIVPVGDFDGSGKNELMNLSVAIDYQKENEKIPSAVKLRDSIKSIASPWAISKTKIDEHVAAIQCDARELTHAQWLANRTGNLATGRLGTIGASSACQVPQHDDPKVGSRRPSSYIGGTPLDLYCKVRGEVPAVPEEEDAARELIFAIGHAAEAYLQTWLQKQYPGSKIYTDTRIYRDNDRHQMTGNMDFIMEMSDGRYIHGEFKTTSMFNSDEWKDGRIPAHYIAQLIHNQHLLNLDESRIVCMVLKPSIYKVSVSDLKNPNFNFDNFISDIVIRSYIRDLDAEADYLEDFDAFWYNNILPGIEPPLSGTPDQITAAISKWKGQADKKATPVALDSEMLQDLKHLYEKAVKLAALNEEVKKIKNDIESQSAAIKQALGTSIVGLCPDEDDPGVVYRVDYKPTKGRDSFKAAIVKDEDPDLYKALVEKGYLVPAKAESGRSFSVKLIREY